MARLRRRASVVLVAVGGLLAATAPVVAQPAAAQTDPAAKLSGALAAIADTVGVQSTDALSAGVGLPATGPGSLLESDGGFLVYVRMQPLSLDGVAAVEAAGATVVHVSDRYQVVTAAMTPDVILPVAQVGAVATMREAHEPIVQRSPAAVAAQAPAAAGAQVGAAAATCPTGVVSEGDTQLKAALARSNFGVDGSGVKVGILSDSFDKVSSPTSMNGDIAAAELPGAANPCGHPTPVSILQDYNGGADEGRAMAQAVHDLAPGAEIMFATAFAGIFAFADNIRLLRDQGADVIVDDVAYLAEPFFQDGPVAVAVNEVVGNGVAYFSSAGNGNETVGAANISSYEAPAFRPATCPATVTNTTGYASATCHDFDAGGTADPTWDFGFGAGGGSLTVLLQWSEPWYGVTDDFDIFYLNAATDAVIFHSPLDSTVPDVPAELLGVSIGAAANRRVVIARRTGTGTPRIKFTTAPASGITSVQYDAPTGSDVVGPSIFGHTGATGAISVAAVPYDDATTPEPYTSHGPVTHDWGPVVGTTPAASNPGQTIAKPDVAATDGGRNSFFGSFVGGVWRFYGTSQSAPHAAAVAALALQYAPGLTPADVRTALQSTAVAVAIAATSDVVGAGLIDADAALGAVPGAVPPGIVRMSPSGGPAGTGVVIEGSHFTGASAVAFNGTPAAYSVDNDGQITATVPAGATTGPVSVTVAGKTGASTADFFVGDPPAGRFTGITPIRALDTRGAPPCVGTTPRNLTIGGSFGVPADASAVALNVTAVEPFAGAFMTVWPRGQPRPLASNLNFVAGQIVPNMVTVKLGTGGAISIYADNGCPNVVVDVAGYYTGGAQTGPGGFQGITPVRALDTRGSPPCVSGPRTLALAGRFGIPVNASAVALNVTVVQPFLPGYLTVWPADKAQPFASNLNFVPGQIVPNMVTVKLSSGSPSGAIKLASDKGCPNVVVDVAGYYEGGGPATAGGFTGVTPVRALDTRGAPPCVSSPRTLDLTPAFVPNGTAAVALNVTVVQPFLPGYLTVYPGDASPPLASNLNFVPGQIVPNMVTVRLSGSGTIKILTDKGCPNVVVDVAGHYQAP